MWRHVCERGSKRSVDPRSSRPSKWGLWIVLGIALIGGLILLLLSYQNWSTNDAGAVAGAGDPPGGPKATGRVVTPMAPLDAPASPKATAEARAPSPTADERDLSRFPRSEDDLAARQYASRMFRFGFGEVNGEYLDKLGLSDEEWQAVARVFSDHLEVVVDEIASRARALVDEEGVRRIEIEAAGEPRFRLREGLRAKLETLHDPELAEVLAWLFDARVLGGLYHYGSTLTRSGDVEGVPTLKLDRFVGDESVGGHEFMINEDQLAADPELIALYGAWTAILDDEEKSEE